MAVYIHYVRCKAQGCDQTHEVCPQEEDGYDSKSTFEFECPNIGETVRLQPTAVTFQEGGCPDSSIEGNLISP